MLPFVLCHQDACRWKRGVFVRAHTLMAVTFYDYLKRHQLVGIMFSHAAGNPFRHHLWHRAGTPLRRWLLLLSLRSRRRNERPLSALNVSGPPRMNPAAASTRRGSKSSAWEPAHLSPSSLRRSLRRPRRPQPRRSRSRRGAPSGDCGAGRHPPRLSSSAVAALIG